METTADFEIVRHRVPAAFAGFVERISGYRELAGLRLTQREVASTNFPLVINLGSPWKIGLGHAPRDDDRCASFTAGIHPGHVEIESDGAAECLQIDFTPLGAFRFFGGAVAELTSHIVDMDDVLGAGGRNLRDRLAGTHGWQRRFALVEAWLAGRLAHSPTPAVVHAHDVIRRTGGRIRISRLADEIGWSRKHLNAVFASEIGVGPKTFARITRFQALCACALSGPSEDWALLAAGHGYADQAHMIREFGELAGESPARWRDRVVRLTPGHHS